MPTDPQLLDPQNYDMFLTARRELIAERLNEYLGTTGHLQMSRPRDPQLTRLDERVENVEVQLRTLIAGRVEQLTTLPRHVLDNITARRDSDRRRNPGMDPGDGTGDLLSYCDLRELQDILTSRELWPLWASTLGTREQLHHRFGQLAALRNAVRHSRQVDDVTRRDGEAALLWFARAIEGARD